MGGYDLQPGDVFVGYTIERVLGVGGMGAVYLAQDPRLPRRTALKLLDRTLTADEDVRARFELEADHAARLEHPNIVSIFDRGREADQDWIAMQYVVGTDAAVAVRAGPMDPARAVHIITETAKALDYAHENSVLHRDVKPANILLGRAGSGQPERVLLTDFGIAKALNETHQLTKTGSLVATMLYAAPEVFEGTRLDHRSDVYSLGCTLFRLLTDDAPYPGPDLVAIVRGHLDAPIPRPSAARRGLPPAFDDIIARALAKDREDRYSSCTALSLAAQSALTAEPWHPTATTPASRLAPTNVRSATPPRATTPIPQRQWAQPAPTESRLQATHFSSAPPPTQFEYPQHHLVAPPQYLPVRQQRKSFPVAIAVLVLAILAGVAAVAYWKWPTSSSTQSTLPFSGLNYPVGVAFSSTGDIFVADNNNNRVLKLTAGSAEQTIVPFSDLNHPTGVALNAGGDLFVTDTKNNRVLSLAAGATSQTVLPFTGLRSPVGIAVSPAGDIFITDNNNHRVLTLAPGAIEQTELPFTDLRAPVGLAVNSSGDLFVADTDNNRVLVLRAGTTSQTQLAFTGLSSPTGVAVAANGEVFVADNKNNRVVRLAAGAAAQSAVDIDGLQRPIGVAVDRAGALLVTDGNRVTTVEAG